MASNLLTFHEGQEDGPLWLILHDRYGQLEDARALGQRLGEAVRRVAIRSARTQTSGGMGHAMGHFWFIGPLDQPELSTFGDGLAELEDLIGGLQARYGTAKINLLGKGEGATMALIVGLMFADLVERVIAIDAVWPKNFDRMPISLPNVSGLSVVLEGKVDAQAERFLRAQAGYLTI